MANSTPFPWEVLSRTLAFQSLPPETKQAVEQKHFSLFGKEEAGQQFSLRGLPPLLGESMVKRESSGNPIALSKSDAFGLMQLTPDAATDVKVDRTVPSQNVRGGAELMRQHLDTFGDLPKAIAAYHAGPGRVRTAIDAGGDQWLSHLGPQTRDYVSNIMSDLEPGRQAGPLSSRQAAERVSARLRKTLPPVPPISPIPWGTLTQAKAFQSLTPADQQKAYEKHLKLLPDDVTAQMGPVQPPSLPPSISDRLSGSLPGALIQQQVLGEAPPPAIAGPPLRTRTTGRMPYGHPLLRVENRERALPPGMVGPPRPEISRGLLADIATAGPRALTGLAKTLGNAGQAAADLLLSASTPEALEARGAGGALEIPQTAPRTPAEAQSRIKGEERVSAAMKQPIENVLQEVESFERDNPGMFTPSKEEGEGWVRKALVRGPESAIQSLAISIPAFLAGGLPGLILSGGTLFSMAEFQQAGKDIEKYNSSALPEKQIPPHIATQIKIIRAVAEGGGEMVSDFIGGKILGLDTFFKGAGKEALQSVLTPSLRKTLGQVSGVAVSETLSEMGTAAAQVAANRLGGIPGPSPLEAAIEAGPQALVASLIFSSVGLGAQRPYMQKTAEALSKADVSPDLRMKAASDISEAIREETKDETLARNFQEAATASIQRGEPIPLDLTAQGVATAGQQQQRSELLTALRERVSRSPVATPTAQPPPVEAKLTTDDIHLLADSRKIAWDNNQDFLVWSEALTGEPHLDRMTPQQLRVVAEAIVRGARPTLQTTPAAPPPDIAAAEVPLGAPAPATPQPTPGTVRFYHGGVPGEGARWLSPDYDYAAEYARKAGQEGASVQYVDIPEGSPLLQKAFDDEGATVKAPHVSFEAPAEVMAQAKPFFLPAPETPAAATIPEPGEAQRLEAPPPVLGQAARLPLLPPGVEQGVMTVSVEPPILGQGATISAAPPILGQAQNPPVETIAALRAPEFRPPPVREEETPLAIASRFANTEESGPVLPPSPAAEEPERVLPPLPLSGSPAAQNIPTPKPSAGPPNRVEQALEAIATGAATFTKAAKQTVRKAVGKVVDGKPVETLSDQALAQAYLAKIQEGEPQALPQTPPLARAIPPVAPDISAPTYGATNKLVSRERAEEVRKRLRDKLNQLNVGIDPEMLSLGAELAVFHLEAGAHSFAQFVKSITQDVGEKARPYLKSWYLAARNWPGMDKSGMQTEQELDAISDEEIDNTIEEQNRAAIDSIRQASEETLAGEPPQDVPGIREERTTPPVPPQRPGIDEESLRGVSIPGSEPASSMGAGTGGVAPSLERGTGPRPRGESPHVDSPGRGRDYIITDTDQIGAGGPKAKYANNVAAIRTLKQILSEGRTATQEEQAVLVKYTGWGALPQVFAQYGDPRLARDEWRNERKELQELLSPSAYQSARASTENAHYTSAPVIREIYRALEHLGFTGGRLLEPSMGVGHFFGLMPPSLASHTARTGIELDKITGEIAKQIYQGSDVRIGGFQDAKIPNGFYDVAVSNVPFGVGIADKNYPPFITKGIHNYFFARALDKVRPGGVVAFITSRYTLDGVDTQVRAYLAERADFLGAVRLPNTAFKDTAGTSVTTDLIFLRKREEGKERSGETWEKTETIADRTSGSLITINEYFVTHPHMLLGEMELAGTMYRGGEPTLTAPQGQNLPQAMREALASLPQNAITPAAAVAQKSRVSYAQDLDPGKTKQNAYFLKGKSLYQNTVSGVIPVSTTDSGALARIKGMVGLRDTVRELLQSQLTDAPDAEISQIQERLGTQYAAFVKAHGLLHDRANVRSFVEDPDLPLLLSLENYDTETKSATRADIFTKRTISPKKTISHAETAKDALLVSLDETGGIDFDRMAQLTGGSLADLREELRGIVFENPEGGWETADAYLSGNVKHKLSVAEGAARADVKYQENVDALIVVQPEDITPSQIDVHLGASWVPTGDLQDFLRYILNVENVPTVRHVPVTASWVIDKPSTYLASSARNVETWGTSRYGAVDLIEDAMNQRLPTVRDQTEDGTSVINQAKTLAAREKQEALKNEFKTWIWADEERATRLSRIYNDTYNNTRLREYNGDHLTFPGMTPLVTLRPHQTGAVWRILQSGNTLLAHVVGGGKTITGIAAAMELRRMGIAKKPMFVVPKHLTEQWAIEFRRLYPAANILLTQKEDFTAANRKRLMSRIATGDWDAVIVAHSSFTRLPVGDDLFNEFLHKEINQLGDAILEAKEARLGTRVIKEIEKAKKRLEKKLREKKEELAQDAVVSFEETGVDFLFVDESDAFKNLFTPTKMTRVSGLPAAESNRSFDLFVKTQYLRRLTNGRGVVFATGTPVSNSMAEVFTMQRYLQPQVLEESGLTNFDAWAQNFGEAVTTIEMKPDGSGYRPRTRFAKFVNVPELIQMFRQVMDVKTAEDLNLPVPKLRGGKPDVHVSPATETLLEFISSLASRASAVQGGHVDSRDDNMLKITSEGRKAALDIRLVLPQAQEDRNGKLNVAAKQIDSLYKETAEGKGVQLVFLDMSTPKAKGAAKKATTPTPSEEDGVESGDVETAEEVTLRDSLYVELQNKLVKSGIKGEEIAFIHQADTDAKKTKLFADANSGKVRVLIGSTEKMGAGTNVQRKLVALHHLDAPWRPRDVAQRNGRILRQGNEFFGKDPNFTVGIHHYVTEKSFDVYMWQTLEAKARMIAQAMSGDLTTRSIEDADKDALTASEIKAIASGNPLVMEKVKVDTEVRKLGMLRSQYKEGQAKAARELTLIPQRIAAAETQVAEIEEAIRLRDTSEKTEKPTAVILGETVVGREDINQALERASSTVSMEEPSVMGNYRGVEIRIRPMLGGGSKSYLQLPNGYSLDVGTLSVGGLNAALSSLDPRLARVEARVANDQKQQKEYASLLGNPFPQEDRLLELTEKQKEIDKELGVDGGDTIREEEDPQPQSLTGERRFIAEEVRKRLGDKLINQLNVGIDPEMLSLEIAGIGQFARKYAGHRAIELETMLGEGRGEKVLSEEQWTQARISTQEADVIETMGQLLTHEGMWRILTRTFGKRYASEISKFFRSFDTTAKRFGVPASRQDALFDSAESIKTFQNGQPVFGSRIFEKDPDTKELMRDQYGLPIMKEWRYTPEQGEEFWDALSDQEKAAVRYWVDMRDIVKEVFNVSGEIEGYMHHFWTNGFFEGLGVLAGRHTRLRKKLAGSRIARQAEEGKGFSHDFERSVVKVWHDLIKEDEWNKMMTRLVPLVTDPIGPDGIRQGWVEIPKNVLTRRGKFIGQIAGGRQIPEELYKEMVAWMEPVKSTSAVADASRSIGSYITANLLLYPGTFANNIVGSGVQYATLVADTAAKAMLTGQVRPFLDVATAPFRALLPSVGQVYSPELLGAHSNLITQFRDRNAVDAAFSGVLSLTMGAVDNYVKRATALAVSQQLGIPKSATQAQVLEMKEAYAEMRKFVDTFGLDYSNVNSRMGKFREYSGSRLISPFVTYGYKIMQMMGHYLAALNPGARMDPDSRFQFDRGGLAKVGLSPEHIERIARLMVLGTIFTLLSSVFPEEEEETGKHLPGMPWSLDRTGMVKLSDVGEKERWYRPGGQPWFPVFLTARALKDWYFRGESPTDELIAAFSGVSPSAGPLLQGLLAARDYYKDPTRFKFGPAFARAAKPFVPFGRISEGIRRQQGGPEVQSRTFVQELAEAAPFPIPDEWIGSRKTIIDPLTKLPVMRNPDFETLRFWTGVFLSDISLQTYRGVRGQMLERTIERLDRAEDMDTYNRAMGQLKELDFPRWRMLQDRANEKRILFSTKELNFQKYLTEKQEAARNPPPVTALPPRSPALPPLREQSAPR